MFPEAAAKETAHTIIDLHLGGRTKAEIFEFLAKKDYKDHMRPVYPLEAFRMNMELMIDRTVEELAAEQNQGR